jgi:phosphonate transport system ATP-binding protein
MPILAVDSLTIDYGRATPALAGVSLSLEAGGFTALLGPSGAGKSSLLRALNGLVRPRAGRVLDAEGRDIATRLRAHRQDTAMVFQQHHLIGRLSALRNVLLGRLAHRGSLASLFGFARADRLAALEALDAVGLLDRALDRADRLSGGQQQRVGIARALAQAPRVLLADEPVASLDPGTAEGVLALFDALRRDRGLATIVSLHQPELAARFADRVIGLSAGRIVFDGPPAALDGAALAAIYRTAPAPQPEFA